MLAFFIKIVVYVNNVTYFWCIIKTDIMKPVYNEFTVKEYKYGNPKGSLVPLVDILFTPIYELIYKGSTLRFKTFSLRKEAYRLLKSNQTRPNSTKEYIGGYEVYNKLLN